MRYRYLLVLNKEVLKAPDLGTFDPPEGYRYVGCTPSWKSTFDGGERFKLIFEKELTFEGEPK